MERADRLWAMLWLKMEEPKLTLHEAFLRAEEVLEVLRGLESPEKASEVAALAMRDSFLREHRTTLAEALRAVEHMREAGRIHEAQAEALRAFLQTGVLEEKDLPAMRELAHHLAKGRGKGKKPASASRSS